MKKVSITDKGKGRKLVRLPGKNKDYVVTKKALKTIDYVYKAKRPVTLHEMEAPFRVTRTHRGFKVQVTKHQAERKFKALVNDLVKKQILASKVENGRRYYYPKADIELKKAEPVDFSAIFELSKYY